MKYSHSLIKKLLPQARNKKDVMEKLTMHAFEAEDAGKNSIEIKLPPNRYSDASSHMGIAREIAAIMGEKFKPRILNPQIDKKLQGKKYFSIEIQDKDLCGRYMGQYFELKSIGSLPSKMQDVLVECGLRPINAVVDIMNYVMLETGQPMHAFDYDKLAADKKGEKIIFVRRAKKGENIETLDNQKIELDEDILVIADSAGPLAIAGIKGGKRAEVDKNTKRIVVESANFDSANIYKTARKINLITDASARFSRGLSSELPQIGIERSAQFLAGLAKTSVGPVVDIYVKKQPRKILKFEIEHCNSFLGSSLDLKTAKKYLELLGFGIHSSESFSKSSGFLMVEVPPLRLDIETHADLYEEIVRLYGYNKLESKAPRVHIIPGGFENSILLRDKIRRALSGMGLTEVYNYSFVSDEYPPDSFDGELVELENPISSDFKYLRPSLVPHLIENSSSNLRFYDEVKIFETGKIFFRFDEKGKERPNETESLGIVMASKKEETLFSLKGVVSELFKNIGLVDFRFVEISGNSWIKDFTKETMDMEKTLAVESGEVTLGYLGVVKNKKSSEKYKISVCEFDLLVLSELVQEENEYIPLSKYPSVMRDVSFSVSPDKKIGNIMQEIQLSDISNIADVDLIDEYGNSPEVRSITLRIVFQSQNRTLTDSEVNAEMDKIHNLLRQKFKADIR